MKNTIDEILLELVKNEEFNERLANVETPEDVQDLLARYGAELSMEEIKGMIQEPEGELLESDLEDVSGGVSMWHGIRGFKFDVIICGRPPRPRPIIFPIKTIRWLKDQG